jgi:Putative porin
MIRVVGNSMILVCLLVATVTGAAIAQETKALSNQELQQRYHILEKRLEALEKSTISGPGSNADALTNREETQAAGVKALEKKVDIANESLGQEYRLLERRFEELEKKVTDEQADKLYKSSWAQRISISGDIRLRYQGDYFQEDNATFPRTDDLTTVLNTTEDQTRYRYRVRLNLKAKIIDDRQINVGKVEGGLRFSSGSENNPISTNETMGDFDNKDKLLIDRAYLKWTYRPIEEVWGGRIPEVQIAGGRMPNPWIYTNLVWDHDLNFEGFVLSLKSDTLASNSWTVSLTGGYFPLQEIELSQNDKYLWGAQLGVEYRPSSFFNLTLAGAYYDFRNMKGRLIDQTESETGELDYLAPLFQTKGNAVFVFNPSQDLAHQKTALAADYSLVDATMRIALRYFYPIEIHLEGDYVKNIAFDVDEVVKLTGGDKNQYGDQGYQFGVLFGYPTISEFGQWNTSMYYRYLETDAVLEAFTDSDFHGGGTNCQGWIAGLGFGLYKNVWLSATWMTADEVEGPPLAQDTFQLDINGRF